MLLNRLVRDVGIGNHMTDKRLKVPGPEHPITVERNPARVVVVVAGRVIADTRESVTLWEASYAPVQYVPRKDVDMSVLEPTAHATFCPYKGDCAYYSIVIGGRRSINAVWTYEAPYPAVAEIQGRLAFYPERVDAIEERRDAREERVEF
jgi:uncharacterized protein (DUF427 family)